MQNQYNLNVKVIADKVYIHKPKESQDLVASITKISQTGEVTIQFNKDMILVQNLTAYEDMLFISLENINEENDLSKLNFDWSVQNISNNEIKIKLEFENPIYISNDVDRLHEL